MNYQFTMVLSREITGEESAALREAGCPEAILTTAALPTNASLAVTQLDFDTEGSSLADVLEAALESVKAVPDLSPASLTVPPHPDPANAVEASAAEASAAEASAAEASAAEASAAEAGVAEAGADQDGAAGAPAAAEPVALANGHSGSGARKRSTKRAKPPQAE